MRFAAGLLLLIGLACAPALAQEETMDQNEPQVNIRFFYLWCNDLLAMREFYSDLIGLKEASFRNDEQYQWLVYDCGSFQLMLFPATEQLPVIDSWGMQPGWEGGEHEGISWSIQIPEDRFAQVVDGLRAGGASTFSDKPLWCQDCYWSFPVRDPMGNTVEVYCTVEERPETTEWSE